MQIAFELRKIFHLQINSYRILFKFMWCNAIWCDYLNLFFDVKIDQKFQNP